MPASSASPPAPISASCSAASFTACPGRRCSILRWEPLRSLHDRSPLHPEVLEVAEGSFRSRRPPRIRGSGYVVRSLEAALWAFHDAADFRQAVLRAVNLGDDADTTGAVCGQLAGAWSGESGIPPVWLEGLAGKSQIEPILERLLARALR